MQPRILLALLAGILTLLLLIWVIRDEPDRPQPAPALPAPQAAATTSSQSEQTEARPSPIVEPAPKPLVESTPGKPPVVEVWQGRIDQVLRSQLPVSQAAQVLIGILPALPEEGQVEAAEHISNLLENNDYAKVRPLFLNPATPEPVLNVFFYDLLNREDEVKLPTLLELAKIPNHPLREEAIGDLELLLDASHGSDWAKWEQAVKAAIDSE